MMIIDLIELKLLSKRSDDLATACYNSYEYIESLEHGLKNNPKLFWTHLKNKRGGSSTYPMTMTNGSMSTSDGRRICEMFATNFLSVYDPELSKELGNGILFQSIENSSLRLTSPTINSETLFKKMKTLDVTKGAGPDGIPHTPNIYCGLC